MSAVTIRNLSEQTHQALRRRAAQNGRSTEAEIRCILDQAAQSTSMKPLGVALKELGRKYDITTEFENLRDKTAAVTDAGVFD